MESAPIDKPPSAARGRRDIVAAAVLWSLGGVFAKSLALDGPTIAFYRGLIAGLALLPFVPRSRWVFRPVMVPLGVCFGAMTGLYLGAVVATTAANAIFLQCTAVFWTVPLSALVLRERPDRRALMGIALGTVGIAAIVLYGYDERRLHEGRGIALGLASGIAYAGVVVGLRGLRDLDPVWLSAFNNLAGTLALGGWLATARGPFPHLETYSLAILIAFGVVQMAIPYVFFARGLRTVPAPEAALIALIEPALNPIWVFLLWGEQPKTATIVGGVLLLAGVAISRR